MYSMIMKKLGK